MDFIKKLLRFIWNRLHLFFINEEIILYSLNEFTCQLSKSKIKTVDLDNLDDALNFQSKKQIEVFKNFLKLGDDGYYAYIEEKCIHRSWVKKNKQIVHFHREYPYKLKNNEIFIHYCETSYIARGKNVYPHVLSEIIKNHNDKKILIAVNKKNIASIKGVTKVGFIELYRVKILIIMGIKFFKVIINDK